jgi:DNA polymerase I-like protein with 3'-5' exonuclease and polymerase domains
MYRLYDYQSEIQSLFPINIGMQNIGMHIDVSALKQTKRDVKEAVAFRENLLKELIGWIPNTKSPIAIGKLFNQFKIPYQLTPKSGKPKISKETLLAIGSHFPLIAPTLSHCLEITKRRTLASNFLGMVLDYDDYYHPTYRLNGTKTGRFASEGADEGGPQGQNWPSHFRNIVVADDPDYDELTSADLKQAEGMLIAWDSEDIFWIRAFQSGMDTHRIAGLVIFHNWDTKTGLPSKDKLATIEKVCPTCKKENLNDCTHSERFIAKSSRYAFSYGMGPRKLVTKQLPPAGVFLTEQEGARIRDKVVTPALARWQQRGDDELKQTRWFTNALGRKREFYGIHDRSGEMLRELLSWKCQSTINIITSRAILKFTELTKHLDPKPRIVTTTHDSLLISHRKDHREIVHKSLTESYQQPIIFHKRELIIPLDIGSGPNWRDAK